MYEGQEIQVLKENVKAARKFAAAIPVKPGSPLGIALAESIARINAQIRELRIHRYVDFYNEAADKLGEPRTNFRTMEELFRTLGK